MTKVGLDDYLAEHGAEELQKLLDAAPEVNASAELWALNAEVVYVKGINAVVQIDSPRYRVMRPRDFVNDVFADRRHNVTVGGRQKGVSTAGAWMQWPGRRTVDEVTFAPGELVFVTGSVNGRPIRMLNLWEGWGATPVPGNVEPFLALVDHVLQGLRPEHKRWFWQWLAYPLQHPNMKLRTAVMLHGHTQGTGKTLLGETMAQLYGEAGKLIGQEQLEREFNEYMNCAAFIEGDEVTTRGSKRDTAERLKNLVTRPSVTINKKFQPVYSLPNVAQFYLTSNRGDALYLEDEDRRFFVHRVENDVLPPEFTKRFAEWQSTTNWQGALLHYLMYRVDCSNFDPYATAPMTEAKQDMIATGLSDIDNWVRQLPNAPIHPDSSIQRLGPLHTAEELRMMALGNNARCSVANVGLAMRKAGFKRAHMAPQIKVAGRLVTLWPTVKDLGPKQLKTLLDARRAAAADKKKLRRFDGRNVEVAAITTERVQ